MPPRDVPTQLLAPASIGRANDGTEVFHTGLWLSPSQKYVFIGLLAEGEGADRPRRPSIVISDGDELRINSFWYATGTGAGDGHCWVLQTEIDPENAWRLSGATLTMRYEQLALEYSAQLAELSME